VISAARASKAPIRDQIRQRVENLIGEILP
jgi:hypothetical protein